MVIHSGTLFGGLHYSPVPSPKKRKRTPSPERDATPEEEKKAEERTTDQVLKYLLNVWNGMAHPIPVKEEGVRWWMERCGRRQIKKREGSCHTL